MNTVPFQTLLGVTMQYRRDLPDAIRNAKNLPSPPAIALAILRVTKDPDSNISDLVEVLSGDPALTTKVIALANTARYRRGSEVSSLTQAATVLGMRTIRLLALSFSLTQSLPQKGGGAFDYSLYWRRSLITAVTARGLLRFVRTDVGDEAFLCGLLARLGQLVMASTLGDEYGALLEETGSGFPTAERESEQLGFNFHDVGAALLDSWGLSGTICDCIQTWEADTDTLDDADPQLLVLVQFMQVADSLADLICSADKPSALSRIHKNASTILGLTTDEVEAFVLGLQSDFQTTSEVFRINDPIDLDIQQILDEARDQAIDVALAATDALQVERATNADLIERQQELISVANTDALTQIPNRAYFDSRLRDVTEARQHGQVASNLGILIMDVDHFKQINDTEGHAFGDVVLRTIAKRLVGATRDTDFIARYGGEEFVAILPNTTLVDLESVAERLRERICCEPVVADGRSINVSISIGGACIPDVNSPKDGHDLLEEADQCLYRAKRTGRNRSVCQVAERSGVIPRIGQAGQTALSMPSSLATNETT